MTLSRCHVGMQTQAGGTYNFNSYKAFCTAINRHLQKLGRNFDILMMLNFAAQMKHLKDYLKSCTGRVRRILLPMKTSSLMATTTKSNTYFFHKKDAHCLTQQVWFYVTLHFGIRGRELQCLLRKTDLQILTDEHGAKYVKLGTDFAPKTSPARRNCNSFWKDSKRGPSPDILISKLIPESDRIFQRPRINYSAKDK